MFKTFPGLFLEFLETFSSLSTYKTFMTFKTFKTSKTFKMTFVMLKSCQNTSDFIMVKSCQITSDFFMLKSCQNTSIFSVQQEQKQEQAITRTRTTKTTTKSFLRPLHFLTRGQKNAGANFASLRSPNKFECAKRACGGFYAKLIN